MVRSCVLAPPTTHPIAPSSASLGYLAFAHGHRQGAGTDPLTCFVVARQDEADFDAPGLELAAEGVHEQAKGCLRGPVGCQAGEGHVTWHE